MNSLTKTLALSACVLISLAPAKAAPQADAGSWGVDYGETRCTLIRSIPEPVRALAIRVFPGSEHSVLVLKDSRWTEQSMRGTGRVDIVLLPSKQTFHARSGVTEQGGDHILIAELPPEPFLDPLASSNGLQVVHDGQELAAMSLPGAEAAVKALRTCNRALLTQWGADPTKLDQLKRLPVGEPGSLFRPSDYPSDALRDNKSGTAIVRYVVGKDGRVADCKIVASSGSASLDRETCAILKLRGRFGPALDSNGAPTEALMVTEITWNVFN